MKIQKYLDDKIFVHRSLLELGRKKFAKVSQLCIERLEKYENNYAALYILSLCAYYQRDMDRTYHYYVQLLTHHKVKAKVQKWFIKNLIAFQLYNKNLNNLVRERCIELLHLTSNRTIQIELLKYLCLSLYRLERYNEVLRVCTELKAKGFNDKHVRDIEATARRLLE
jgi:hypothetical protein